jgi:hypothetical protein
MVMKRRGQKGSMMLEAVLVAPIVVFFIFFLIQICMVWVAKEVTYYAAYCGARAALVYNPEDYMTSSNVAKVNSGPVHLAACTVLSWIGYDSTGDESGELKIAAEGGDYHVPGSSRIRESVSVNVEEYKDNFPAVTVNVEFKYPLVIPCGGVLVRMIFEDRNLESINGPNTVTLRERCTLAKPWKTETFPLIPDGEPVK